MSNQFISGQPLTGMTPAQIVQELDKFIIEQKEAKRAVAVALRNRERRSQVESGLRAEIKPKNILMIGPTGVGKTEIARRLASLANAPFIKVEATKFTEVGYVGRDVDSIIRDLTDVGVKMMREQAMEKVKSRAMDLAEERILDVLLPNPKATVDPLTAGHVGEEQEGSMARQLFRKKLREGSLDDQEIEIKLNRSVGMSVDIIGHPGMEEMTNQLKKMFQDISPDKPKKRKMRVKEAYKALQEEEAMKLINEEEIKNQALERVAQSGIVFIDEIDKIAQKSDFRGGADVSREGVQRDLLPLIEGSTVNTKYGSVNTDHILFIASGAFHVSKPSDLIPELQGRLPIRVELDALTADDFVRILTEPYASLTMQVQILMATENVRVEFTADGVRRIAEAAYEVNERIENIGARRLHTIMERVIEELSFNANLYAGKTLVIDAQYVNAHLSAIMGDEDLSRFIL